MLNGTSEPLSTIPIKPFLTRHTLCCQMNSRNNYKLLDNFGKIYYTSQVEHSISPNAAGRYNSGSGVANGRPRLQPVNTYDSPLLMTSGDSPEANIIHRIDNDTAARNLGVYLNASGTFSHHTKVVKMKSDTLAHRPQSSRLAIVHAAVLGILPYNHSVVYWLFSTSNVDD